MKIIIAGILLLIALETSFAFLAPSSQPQVAAAQEQSSLYAKMLELPRGKQVEMYASLSPAERSSLWRAHLGHMLSAMPLNESQQKVVVEAINLSTPQLFDGSEGSRKTVREFTQTVKAAFDKETGGAIFARMEPIGIRAASSSWCNCSLVSDWCFQSLCYLGGCSTTKFGCGLMWAEACEGTCR